MSTLTSAVSAGLFLQLVYGGGEVPSAALLATGCLTVALPFLVLGVYHLLVFLH